MAFNYLSVCKYFRKESKVKKIEEMGILKLMKLLYIAHAYFLIASDIEEFEITGSFIPEPDCFQAWIHGPVYPKLYNEYRSSEKSDSFDELNKQIGDAEQANKEKGQILNAVYSKYGELSAWNLVSLTHLEGTPWNKARRKSGGKNTSIPDKDIKEYYEYLLTHA